MRAGDSYSKIRQLRLSQSCPRCRQMAATILTHKDAPDQLIFDGSIARYLRVPS